MSLDTTAMNNDPLERSTHGTTPVTPADSKHELLREHPRFFYDDGNVEFQVRHPLLHSPHAVPDILQVENVLYKLHRFFFSHHSPWFRARFDQPESDSEPGLPAGWECVDGMEGVQVFVNYDRRKTMFEPPSPALQADSDVIMLENVRTHEFDALLSIFYPECVPSPASFFRCAKTDMYAGTLISVTSPHNKNGSASYALPPFGLSTPSSRGHTANSTHSSHHSNVSCLHDSTTMNPGLMSLCAAFAHVTRPFGRRSSAR